MILLLEQCLECYTWREGASGLSEAKYRKWHLQHARMDIHGGIHASLQTQLLELCIGIWPSSQLCFQFYLQLLMLSAQ